MRSLRVPWLLLVIAFVALSPAGAESWAPPSGNYVTLRACRLVESGANDGDSFMVKAGGKDFLFRLYAVDAAETAMSYPDRVAAQAQHFGITSEQAVKSGLEAKKFTQRLLVQPFTVQTCWQDAKGASHVPRYYAIVTLGDGRDLAELLAAAGLARVYGWTPTTPGFSLPKMQALERQARSRRLGAYGLAKPGAAVASAAEPNASRLPPTLSAFATPARATSISPIPAGGKLNPNTATLAELEALPGIGPHYAQLLIAGRPYKSIDDILRVKGVGPKTLAKFAAYISIGGR